MYSKGVLSAHLTVSVFIEVPFCAFRAVEVPEYFFPAFSGFPKGTGELREGNASVLVAFPNFQPSGLDGLQGN